MDGEIEDGRWLTYAELAELRGISKASATRMSFRHKWRRQDETTARRGFSFRHPPPVTRPLAVPWSG